MVLVMLSVHDRVQPMTIVADIVLGVRILLSASKGLCAYKGSSNCTVHNVMGAVITSASVGDFFLAIIFIHFFDRILKHLGQHTRKVRHSLVRGTCQRIKLLDIKFVI
jgi:hypothetical protein